MARRIVRIARSQNRTAPAAHVEMMQVAPVETVSLTLTGMAPTGEAIGRFEGMVVFVPFGLPGEVVDVHIVERKKKFARGELVARHSTSPVRTEPVCRYYGRCGGCDLQHVVYAEQVAIKTAIVREQLARIGRFSGVDGVDGVEGVDGVDGVDVRPCIASPAPYAYRNHARLAVARNGRLGYRAGRSHDVVVVDDCPILEPVLNERVQALSRTGVPGHHEEIELRGWTDTVDVNGIAYRVSSGAFFQANTAVAGWLVDAVMEALAPTGDERVLDLYCGVGLFTVPVGKRVALIWGVESSALAVADAEYNLTAAGIGGKILEAEVGVALTSDPILQMPWDAVVLDPPRTGVDAGALAAIGQLAAPKLIYVSCEPATLARDARLLGADGYVLTYVQPFDMFPQTHHVETLAVFTRQAAAR